MAIMLRAAIVFRLVMSRVAVLRVVMKSSKSGVPMYSGSDAEIVMELALVGVQFTLRKGLDHDAMFHHVVAVRDRRGETKILLHQHDGEALFLEGPDRAADLLDDHGCETLGRL